MAQVVIPIPRNQWWDDDLFGINDQVETIFSNLEILENRMDEAERRSLKEKEAREWLKKFIGMTDELEVWWDEFRIITFQNTRKNVDPDPQVDGLSDDEDEAAAEANFMKRVSTLLSSSLKKWNPSGVRKRVPPLSADIASKTRDLNSKLDAILNNATGSGFFQSAAASSSGGSSSSGQSFAVMVPTIGSIYGHVAAANLPIAEAMLNEVYNLEEILRVLMPESSSSSNEIKVICITGEWRYQITRMAKQLYIDDRVKQYFEVRRWITVANRFEAVYFANDLLGGAQERIASSSSDRSWELLFQMVEESFYMKRFLIVLDDIVLDHCPVLDRLICSLKQGAPGSVILVTSCEDASQGLRLSKMFGIEKWSPEEGWHLLKVISLFGRSNFSEELENIGRDIVAKCGCMTFDLKIIGSLLRLKDTVPEWEEVLHSKVWEMEEVKKQGYCPLYISYSDLPLPLQRCFLYLGVFDLDSVTHVEQLIAAWMAEGYLGPPSINGDRRRRMKGLEYFNQLVNRSFFLNFVKSSIHKDQILSFQVNIRVLGFAKWLAGDQVSTSAVLGQNKARSSFLIAYRTSDSSMSNFLRYECIRLLDLSSSQLRSLPREIRRLTLLQYLNLCDNPLKRLPETVCDLLNLEFLDVSLCYMLVKLPKRIGKLQRLKHLRIDHTTDELQKLPPSFASLRWICTLDVLRIGGQYNSIGVLEHLDNLEEICIAIHGKVDFEHSNLERKTRLQSLELCFVGQGRDPEVVTLVKALFLNAPPSLEILKIEGYHGIQLPKWIVTPRLGEILNFRLRRLTVRSALNLLSLPSFYTMQSLEFLWLDDIPNLKHLDKETFAPPKVVIDVYREDPESHLRGFDKGIPVLPALRTLRIESLVNWETWEDLDERDEKFIHIMPCLQELIINGCPKLKVLPDRIFRKMISVQVSYSGNFVHPLKH
ncbi:OLC1v1038563C1 [Oldenlandia corymbosa var. corymbosa]|uniref:OLC1v1038563C1 n=1 Tax=Oldenlandia corymbosa var. corymbosa TaxID=529605 RepID=A0AAV1D3U8_OLDCO|nr:OLC1v1038563C1 [Oldenlandia corymbosa var. corymbosa]